MTDKQEWIKELRKLTASSVRKHTHKDSRKIDKILKKMGKEMRKAAKKGEGSVAIYLRKKELPSRLKDLKESVNAFWDGVDEVDAGIRHAYEALSGVWLDIRWMDTRELSNHEQD